MRRAEKLILFFVCLLVYGATNYGGIRSPDAEVIFRTAESLESRRSFAVPRPLELYPGFGLAPGRHGRLYSVFGPLQPILEAPLVRLAKLANRTGWYERRSDLIPLSHYHEDALRHAIFHTRPPDIEPHALRFLVSFFNSVVTALAVVVFHSILLRLGLSGLVSLAVSLLYAFGTLAWPYAGTHFGEPLATLFVLLSVLFLIEDTASDAPPSPLRLAVSGLCIGLAVAAHVTAALFVPVFLLYLFLHAGEPRRPRASWRPVLYHAAGLSAVVLLLGLHNYARFGSFFETGRWVNPEAAAALGYGRFVPPWRGLYGLLLSPGKGLFLFTPAALLGVLTFAHFRRAHPALAAMLAAAIALRVIFIASRSDWHGGFSLGPRYLVMVIPFFLIPTGFWLQNQIGGKRSVSFGLMAVGAALLVARQFSFVMDDVFVHFHVEKLYALSHDIDPFAGDALYLTWAYSPLTSLPEVPEGASLLRGLRAPSALVCLAGSVVVVLLACLALVSSSLLRRRPAG